MTSETTATSSSDDGGISTAHIIISTCVLAVCVIVGAIGCICCYKYWKKKEQDEYETLSEDKKSQEGLRFVQNPDQKPLYKAQSWQEGKGGMCKLQRPPSTYSLQAQPVQPPNWAKGGNPTDRKYTREQSNSSSSSQVVFEEDDADGWPLQGVSQWVSDAVTRATSQNEADGEFLEAQSPAGEKLGRIEFNLQYNFQELELTLKIIRAVNLPAKDFSGTSDPYVKIMLLPDKNTKMKTNVKRKNLNPRWNETFAFQGYPYNKLMTRTLHLQVYDYDRFSRDDPIGEVCVPLNALNLEQGESLWRDLQPCKGQTGRRGELLVSLCYNPTSNQLKVDIMKARELKAKDINGYSDPYVKIWLLKDGKRVEKRKTTIKERNLNPVYNESFIFEIPYENLRTTSLMFSVKDHDRMGRNETIGELLLGSKSGPMETKHWGEMFAKARQPVAQWHVLKKF